MDVRCPCQEIRKSILCLFFESVKEDRGISKGIPRNITTVIVHCLDERCPVPRYPEFDADILILQLIAQDVLNSNGSISLTTVSE
jgi:hypothetical protein